MALLATPSAQVTSGFFRTQMLVVLGLTALAALSMPGGTQGTALAMTLVILAMAASFVGAAAWLLEMRRSGQVLVAGVATATGIAAVLGHRSSLVSGTWELISWLDPLAGALVLGTTMTAMLLGHWYLVTPTMAMAPLRRLVGLMGASVLLRALLAGLGISVLLFGETEAGLAGVLSERWWIWGALRWLSGILGAAVVVGLTWETVKIGSTQSATGILLRRRHCGLPG